MINIFVTYRCNLACPYCFATELTKEYPTDLTPEDFARLLEWMPAAGVTTVAFIGGEPTLHPRIATMVQQAAASGMAVALFTNGLFAPELAEELVGHVTSFVVNYNEPSLYTDAQQKRLHHNLQTLSYKGASISFSKNFSHRYSAYDYLLEGCGRYGVTSVRYDISRPSHSSHNDHYTLDEAAGAMSHVVDFVRACDERNIRTGLDCSVRLCDLRMEDRKFLERVSMKFTGVCHPSIDIHPDLSASYCLPLRGVRVDDVTKFASREALMWHFADAARPMRSAAVSQGCLDCRDFMRRCQGGCLAQKMQLKEQPTDQSADQSKGQFRGIH